MASLVPRTASQVPWARRRGSVMGLAGAGGGWTGEGELKEKKSGRQRRFSYQGADGDGKFMRKYLRRSQEGREWRVVTSFSIIYL